MKPLRFMDNEVQKVCCGKCDYMNNKVAIKNKKPNCIGINKKRHKQGRGEGLHMEVK